MPKADPDSIGTLRRIPYATLDDSGTKATCHAQC